MACTWLLGMICLFVNQINNTELELMQVQVTRGLERTVPQSFSPEQKFLYWDVTHVSVEFGSSGWIKSFLNGVLYGVWALSRSWPFVSLKGSQTGISSSGLHRWSSSKSEKRMKFIKKSHTKKNHFQRYWLNSWFRPKIVIGSQGISNEWWGERSYPKNDSIQTGKIPLKDKAKIQSRNY